MKYIFAPIDYASPEYDEAVDLRTRVLRIPLGIEFRAEDLSEEYDQHHFGLYDARGGLVACLVFKDLGKGCLKMRQVAVDPERQQSGLGQTIVSFAEQWARRKGYKKIELAARDTAVPFYLKQQYEVYGSPFIEVGIPHTSMCKIL